MEHHHSHHHSHHNHHHHQVNNYNKAFAFGIILNVVFIIVEVVYGIIANSSALIADAGHNTSDVFGLLFAWGAIWLAGRKPQGDYSYGYKKSTILISLTNAVILFVAAAFILHNAIEKIITPEPVASTQIMIVAGIGIVINGITALLFMKGQKHDLNIKGAFMHMAADAAVSLGVVVSGLLIKYTGYTIIDPIMSLIIVFIIVIGTWKLFQSSVKLALSAVPEGLSIKEVKNAILKIEAVDSIHDLHIWALSTSENALSAHVTTKVNSANNLLSDIQKELSSQFNIEHTTIQIEKGDSEFNCEQRCN